MSGKSESDCGLDGNPNELLRRGCWLGSGRPGESPLLLLVLGTQLGAWGPSFVKWVSKCCEAYVQ